MMPKPPPHEGTTPDSFYQVYKEYYESLVNFVTSYVSRRDIAEDLVQELFASFWEKEPNFPSRTALNTYLYVSAKNLALDYLKHLDVENRYAEQVLSNTRHGFSEEKLDEDVMLLLFRCIDRLPERCREIFLLHLDGLSNEEIAKQLNLSVLTVKTQKRNAMKVLRDYFRQRPLSPSEFSCIFLLLAYLSCERLSF